MARVHGVPGSERVLVQNLRKRGIKGINSLSDVELHITESDGIIARKEDETRQAIRREIEHLHRQSEGAIQQRDQLRQQRTLELKEEHSQLVKEFSVSPEPTRNPFLWIYRRLSRYLKQRRKRRLEDHFFDEVAKPFKDLYTEIERLASRTEYLESNSDEEVAKRLADEHERKRRIDRALSDLASWRVGALGERKTLDALRELPDSYHVINDVNVRLKPPVSTEFGPIVSCQIDHVVVGPSGVFNIESKYWSKESLDNNSLYSPIQQTRRAGRGLFVAIQRKFGGPKVKIRKFRWSLRKFKVRSIISVTGAWPKSKPRYVKIMRPNRLVGYIQYFGQELTPDWVSKIARWLWSKTS